MEKADNHPQGVRKSAHDARLAATMKLSGIGRILTFNVTDFARFDGIAAIHPNSI